MKRIFAATLVALAISSTQADYVITHSLVKGNGAVVPDSSIQFVAPNSIPQQAPQSVKECLFQPQSPSNYAVSYSNDDSHAFIWNGGLFTNTTDTFQYNGYLYSFGNLMYEDDHGDKIQYVFEICRQSI